MNSLWRIFVPYWIIDIWERNQRRMIFINLHLIIEQRISFFFNLISNQHEIDSQKLNIESSFWDKKEDFYCYSKIRLEFFYLSFFNYSPCQYLMKRFHWSSSQTNPYYLLIFILSYVVTFSSKFFDQKKCRRDFLIVDKSNGNHFKSILVHLFSSWTPIWRFI